MNIFLPVSINITNRKILIVGGGNVALLKASGLNRFTDKLTILAPYVLNKLKEFPFSFIYKTYESGDILGYYIVYACTNSRDLNKKIHEDCNNAGILVAVCDDPTASDLVMPAVCMTQEITISVGTNGNSPRKGISIRNQIQKLIEDGVICIEQNKT